MSQKKIIRASAPVPLTLAPSGKPGITIHVGDAVNALEPLALLIGNPRPVAAMDMHLLVRLFTTLKNHPEVAGAEAARTVAAKKYGEDLGAKALKKIAELEEQVKQAKADATPCEELERQIAEQKKIASELAGRITVSPESMKLFVKEYGPIADKEIHLSIAKLPASVLIDAPKATGSQMAALEPFIE